LEDICIVHLDSSYIRKGELDINYLFSKPCVKKEILTLQPFIAAKVAELKKVLQLKAPPVVGVGSHCNKPYTCDFTGFCHKDIVPEIRDNDVANIDKKALRLFIKNLNYPLYFLDFETYMTAVPMYDGHWSYRQIVFQYSLHIQQKEEGPVEHCSYLADHVGTPMEILLEKLLAEIGTKGSIIVYNVGFENTRLKELKRQYPAYGKQIEKLQDRFVDLMIPFRKKRHYLPTMQGSYSIKYVLLL
jgi:hypothetical protein